MTPDRWSNDHKDAQAGTSGSNLPFGEWTGLFGSERLTGALLDRLTHHVHILEMNGDSFRLKHSKRQSADDPQPTEAG
jgi:DNA replication protein DnaC